MVSIVMPVWNAAAHLPAALASVRRQTWPDWELLAIDDGSTDGSAALLAAAAAADSRVRPLFRPHQGLVAALNAGLAACSGAWLARFDADDVMHRDRLLLQRREEFSGVLGCGVRCFPIGAVRDGYRRYETWLNGLRTHAEIVADLFVESPFAHPSVMLPTALLRAVGGWREAGWPEDYDLWLRLWRQGAPLRKLPEVLHFWRDHPDRLSRSDTAYSPQAFRACKLAFLRETFLKDVAAVTLWGAGEGGKLWARDLRAAGYTIARHIDIDPRKIGGRLGEAPVVSPEALPLAEPVLVTVGVAGARELIRARLSRRGLIDGRDYVCVA